MDQPPTTSAVTMVQSPASRSSVSSTGEFSLVKVMDDNLNKYRQSSTNIIP